MTRKFLLTGLSFCIMIATCITMFLVKYEVVQKEEALYDLNKKIISDRKEIHILKAELAHLTDPERLRDFAEKYTKLKEIKPFQIIDVSDLNDSSMKIEKASYKKAK